MGPDGCREKARDEGPRREADTGAQGTGLEPCDCREEALRWYTRGYLPHYDSTSVNQSITFRLADSLPQERLRRLAVELARFPANRRELARRQQMERWLDAGVGCCALRHPALAALVQETLWRWDHDRYVLLAWCVMPTHVHVVMEPRASLPKIVQSWKSYTGRWALGHNDELGLGIPGPRLWMRECWDRYIRDADHFQNAVNYTHDNPVKAGLCRHSRDWPWSSAKWLSSVTPSA